MKLKWFGTASVLLEYENTKLLFDPFIPLNKKSIKPSINEFASIKNILVTHGHVDHISDIPAVIKQGINSVVYCTARPMETLVLKGVDKNRIHKIKPGDVLDFGPFKINVLRGKHIVFDAIQVIKTLLSPRILANLGNFRHILNENKVCSEAGETVVYEIAAADKRILLMGSLNLDENTEYPKNADLLVLPFQGRSDLDVYAMDFIKRLEPKKVLLDHFDNSFPPVSSSVDTGTFIKKMKKTFPGIPVICPEPGELITLF